MVVLISYAPTGSNGTLYPPFSLLSTVRVKPLSVCLTVILTPGTTAPEASRTTPTMVAVEVCAKTRQFPNAIKATIVVTNLPNARRLIPVPLTIFRSFRMQSKQSGNKYGRRPGLGTGSSCPVLLFIKRVALTAVAGNERPLQV